MYKQLLRIVFCCFLSFTGVAQTKQPAIFNNYNAFVDGINKTGRYVVDTVIADECRKMNTWTYKALRDSMDVYVSVQTPPQLINTIQQIYISYTVNGSMDLTKNEKVIANAIYNDIAALIDDKAFKKDAVNDFLGKFIDDFDNNEVILKSYGIAGLKSDYDEIKRFGYSYSFENKLHPYIYSKNEDTLALKMPVPAVPDSFVPRPITKLQSIFENYEPVKDFMDGLLEIAYYERHENGVIKYKAIANTDYNCANNTNKFTHGFEVWVDSITGKAFNFEFNYECKGATPKKDSWRMYTAMLDYLCKFLGIERPEVLTDEKVVRYTSGIQRFYPAYGMEYTGRFYTHNCSPDCGVTKSKNFVASFSIHKIDAQGYEFNKLENK